MLNKYRHSVFLILAAFIVFLSSYFTPRMFDDFYFETFTRGSGTYFHNLIAQMKVYYLGWGGRILAHTLAAMALSLPPFVYALLNTLIFASVVFFISELTIYFLKQDKKLNERFQKTDVYFLTLIFVLLFAKKPMQTIFWTTGSMNYLWMAAFQLGFLFLNKEWLFGDKYLKSKWYKLPLFYLTAFFAALTNENAGFALLGLIGAVFIFRNRSGKKLFVPNEIIVSILLLISTAILILAPGNAVRKAAIEAGGATSFGQKLNWFVESYLIFWGRLDGVILLLTVLFIYLAFKAKKSVPPFIQNQIFLKLWILFLAGSFVFLGHNGNFYGRSSFNISLFFILISNLLVFSFLSQSSLTAKRHESLFNKMKLFLAVAIIAKMIFTLSNIIQFKTYYAAREKEILEQAESGKKEIVTYNFRHSQIYDLEDLTADPKSDVNGILADRYKVKSIVAPTEKTIPWVKRNR